MEEKRTILECMSDIVEAIKSREDSTDMTMFYKNIYIEKAQELEFIAKMCGITQRQAIILSCCIESSCRHSFDKEDLAGFLGLSYIKLLSWSSDFEALQDKKLLMVQKDSRIHVLKHVIHDMSRSTPYEAPDFSGLDTSALLNEMKEIIKQRIEDDMDEDEMLKDLDILMKNNPENTFVKTCHEYKIIGRGGMNHFERILFYILVYRYIYEDDDNVDWGDYSDIFDSTYTINILRKQYMVENLSLQKNGVIEPVFADGMADGDSFHIKDAVKEKLFEEVGGLRKSPKGGERMKALIPEKIQIKNLFYNRTEGEQIERLASLMTDDNYRATVLRLKESGLRTGFCCLFYGAPGTGKTETAYQLAKRTGRAIIPVSVADVKSCWVGETEKMMKGIFQKYRRMANDSELMPILLFNECDQLFGIRREAATSAVDKMENSVQNIILEEMEKFSGIMIASTNLTENLDPAFSRRFIFKVKFEKPSCEAKGKIWMSNFPTLSENEADELASSFDFSGGQIENVSRKKVIQTIIEGSEPDFDQIKAFCREEPIDDRKSGMKKIGY